MKRPATGMSAAEGADAAGRYAITFGEVAILHIGGAEIGTGMRERGFLVAELCGVKAKVEAAGGRAELHLLSEALPPALRGANEAATLLIRDGASLFLGPGAAEELLQEQRARVAYDQKFWDRRRSRTLCKRARHNVVFGEQGAAASADFKQCTVKAFGEVPRLRAFRDALPQWLGERAQGLCAEGNHYFEAASGIGFHGDSERKIVVCLCLGRSSTLRYHWRLPGSSEHTLPPRDLRLHHGDVYVMSEKATGFDWRHRASVRLVHGAGSARYIGEAAAEEA